MIDGAFEHWFVVPVCFAGTLAAADALRWAHRSADTFDPIAIVGLIAFYCIFVAPLLHVGLDYWMSHPSPPEDWREWLGWLAVVNSAGMVFYRRSRAYFLSKLHYDDTTGTRRVWVDSAVPMATLLVAGLASAATVQWSLYQRFGGVPDYMSSLTDRGTLGDPLLGTGWLVILAESFVPLVVVGYVTLARALGMFRSWPVIAIFLVACALLLAYFGGLRGSRSTIVWNVFWAVGAIHYSIRRVPKAAVAVGLVALIGFMYVYGLYKSLGVDTIQALRTSESVTQVGAETGRTLSVVLLGDLSRSDVQALLLYRLTSRASDYRYSYGRTYLGALAMFVPKTMWPERPPTKVKEGTDALYGMGTYASGLRSSRIYGLAGEALLNFGPVAMAPAFCVLGLVVAISASLCVALKPSDSRRSLLPLLTIFCFWTLLGDCDNLVWFLVKYAAVPFLVLYFGSKRLAAQADKCHSSRLPSSH